MTYFATSVKVHIDTEKDFENEKKRLINSGYRLSRQYGSYTHFNNKNGIEVVLIKNYEEREVVTNGRT